MSQYYPHGRYKMKFVYKFKMLICIGATALFCEYFTMHAMRGDLVDGKQYISVQQRYSRAKLLLQYLLEDRMIDDYREPYGCFRSILAMPAEEVGPLREAAAHKLGLMCKAHIGVPDKENGAGGARKYFSFAAYNGHIRSVGELARCALECGNRAQAKDYWRQERFLEEAHECLQTSTIHACASSAIPAMQLNSISHAIDLASLLKEQVKKEPGSRRAAVLIEKLLEQFVAQQNNEACCLLARLYRMFLDDKQAVDYIQPLISRVLSSCPIEQFCRLIISTKAEQALRLVAQTGDSRACSYLGTLLYKQHNYQEAYTYLHRAAQVGEVQANCYCLLLNIMGYGSKQPLKDAAIEIEKLSREESGRQEIGALARLCTKENIDRLITCAKDDEHAQFILGVIIYARHDDDSLAFSYLHTLANNSIYACYCCAQMLRYGRCATQLFDEAARMYGRILVSHLIDDQMRENCMTALKEMGKKGNIPASCEYILSCLCITVSVSKLIKVIEDMCKASKDKQAEYVRYLLSPVCNKRLTKEKKEGNARAMFVLGKLYEMKAVNCGKIDERIQLFEQSFELIQLSHREKVASDHDMGNVGLGLGRSYSAKKVFDRAKESFESAAALGNREAKGELAFLLLQDKKSTAKDIERGIALLEESAVAGHVEHQRFLAQILRSDSKCENSSYIIKANIAKSYRFSKMLLETKPDDLVGRYIMGILLGMHSGQDGIPADQVSRAYDLLSSVIDQVPQANDEDYYLLGRLSFSLRNYIQAISWFKRAGDLSCCLCYRGLCMLCEYQKGNKSFRKNEALELIEEALIKARKCFVLKRVGFSELFCNETLIQTLKQDADAGDQRARVNLARIAYLFEDERIGISKKVAFEYLLQASDDGVASASSYIGFMYYHAQGVARSYTKAIEFFIKASRQPELKEFILEEIIEELIAMTNESEVSAVTISAAYYAIPMILQNSTPDNVKRAIFLMNKAETDLVHKFADDKSLVELVYSSGALSALKVLADKGNGEAAAALGLMTTFRFVKGIIGFDQVKNEGFPFLEQASRSSLTDHTSESLIDRYLYCLNYALQHQLCSYKEGRALFERARTLNPTNQASAYALASFYRNYAASDIDPLESYQKGLTILEHLAAQGHELAALDLGCCYLSGPCKVPGISEYLKAIKFLTLAAKKGNRKALIILVCTVAKERPKRIKRFFKDLVEFLDLCMANPETSAEDKLFLLGTKYLVLHQWEKAHDCFGKLLQGSNPQTCAEIGLLWLHIKEDYALAVDLFLKTIDMAGCQRILISGTNIAFLMNRVLLELREKAKTDQSLMHYVVSLQSKLKQYNYTL